MDGDIAYQQSSGVSYISSSMNPSSSKRRFPGSNLFGGGSKGDAKSRKRDEPKRGPLSREPRGLSGDAREFPVEFSQQGTAPGPNDRDKDQLKMIDTSVVDFIRKGMLDALRP
jgi:hypothetical protein